MDHSVLPQNVVVGNRGIGCSPVRMEQRMRASVQVYCIPQILDCEVLVVVSGYVEADDGVVVPVHDGTQVELRSVWQMELRHVRLPHLVPVIRPEPSGKDVLVYLRLLAWLIEILLLSYSGAYPKCPHPVQHILPGCPDSELGHQFVCYPPVSVDLVVPVEEEDDLLIQFPVPHLRFAWLPA